MKVRSLLFAAVATGAVALSGAMMPGRLPAPAVAQDGLPATRTPDDAARLADLQTRVADLTTQVAELGGADPAALAGRLGGGRSGFDARFGPPTAYLGPDLLQWDAPGLGRIVVTFEQGAATAITALSPRAAGRPLEEPDPADWTPARAAAVAADLAPADAGLPGTAAGGAPVQAAASEALRQAGEGAATGACQPAGPRGFSIAWAAPDPDHVAGVTLTAGPALEPAAPPTPERAGRSTRGANAVANSSLGGSVSVNGLRMQALDVDQSPARSLPGGGSVSELSIELAIGNQTRKPVRFEATDFVLVDADGYELTASCLGPEPSLAQAEVAKGGEVDGWVTFLVPEGFAPQRLVVVTGNARVGFTLR